MRMAENIGALYYGDAIPCNPRNADLTSVITQLRPPRPQHLLH